MLATAGFILSLVVGSLITGAIIGFGVQWAASEFDLGPIPRMFIGGFIIIPSVILISVDLNIPRAFPVLLAIYYIGTFQIGTRIAHVMGMQAPDDNDPPDFFFELLNRYQ